ncbi:hypothetical protein JL721_13183 [Aureococcus anophagefferens]|nr:hypothetical protein JL721_13183 [Aureococcus anophagefferens]
MSMRLATAVACGLAVAAAFAPPRGPLRASPARGASAAGATTSAGDDACAMLSLNARGVNGATVLHADGGDAVYEGAATIVAGGTTPFYGGGLRLFPFARSDPGGKLHRPRRCRRGAASPARLPSLATTAPAEAFDFLGDEFTVALLDGKRYPFQQSGTPSARETSSRSAAGRRDLAYFGPPAPLAHPSPRH